MGTSSTWTWGGRWQGIQPVLQPRYIRVVGDGPRSGLPDEPEPSLKNRPRGPNGSVFCRHEKKKQKRERLAAHLDRLYVSFDINNCILAPSVQRKCSSLLFCLLEGEATCFSSDAAAERSFCWVHQQRLHSRRRVHTLGTVTPTVIPV